jgi:predicted extracellular nuclease
MSINAPTSASVRARSNWSLSISFLAILIAASVIAMLIPAASADTATPVSITTFGTAVTENFNTLASAGTSSTTPTGFGFVEALANANTTYTAGTGSSNTGDTYSFGAASNPERALGGLQSGTLIPTIGASFTNNTGGTITSLDISYTGEQWRLGTLARVDRLDFQISTDATLLSNGTWTDVNTLDFTAPTTGPTIGALDGNAAANRTAISSTITGLSITNGATFFIRWNDLNATGADDGLAVDDFSLTANGTPGDTPPSVTATSPTNGATDVAAGSNISITFSESVNATTSSFTIECPTGTPRTFTLSSSPSTTFTLDPTTDLPASTICTVTVLANQITDQDTNDPPDNMTSDFVFSFTTVAPVADFVVINELDSDTPLTDVAEFVELYDGGVGNTSLNGLVLVFYNGNGDVSYRAIDLDGFTTNASGYFTAGNSGVSGVDVTFPSNTLQNGEDAVALYVGNASSFPNGTAVTASNLIDAIVYDTGDPDDPGLLVLLNAGQPQVDEDSGGQGDVVSNGRCPNGSGGQRNTSSYKQRAPSPDGANDCPPPPVFKTIPEIQGNGATSPFAGVDVITTGIVTAKKSNGFFLQTSDADAVLEGDPTTSQALFVFTSVASPVAVGDGVTVTGTATEFFLLTQISAQTSDISIDSSGNPLPTPITLTTTILNPAGLPDQLERFEGMRTHADSLTSVAPTNNFAETFTVITGVPRPMREPGIEISLPVPPDPTSGVPDCCIPRWDENPERIMIDSDGLIGSTVISVTSNVTITNVTGPLDFSFGDYKILPEITPTVTSTNMSAVPVPTPVPGEFTIAGYNIENFANDETQRKKAALAIRDVLHLPDVIGTIEIFELSGLQALADEIETISGVHYEARLIESDGTSGDSDQDVGFLVKTSRVQIDSVTQIELAGCNGTAATCNTFIDPDGNPALLNDRPPLVLRGTVDALTLNPRPVIVIVNHTRSFIDIELVGGDGPRVRAKRKAQAEFLADLLQDLQVENPSTPIMSIGDYNAYQFNDGYTDPVSVIKGTPTADDEIVVDASPDLVNPNFINLTDTLPADQRYSFIFEGTPQAIDHQIINTVAASYFQRYHIARNNIDFPELPASLFSGDATRPERNSDHDMPVGYFLFPKAATTTTVSDASAVLSPSDQTVVLTANVTSAAGTVNEGSVTFTVRNAANAVVGLPVVGNVSGGVATANYILPGGTLPQALTITGEFSGGTFTAPSTDTATLSVSFNICLLYDPTKAVKSGATYTLKIQLCDINGSNVSSSSTIVHAVGVGLISTTAFGDVEASGNANPDNNFRFDSSLGGSGGYIYNLKTTGLSTGTYNVYFNAGNDPVLHALQFQVK